MINWSDLHYRMHLWIENRLQGSQSHCCPQQLLKRHLQKTKNQNHTWKLSLSAENTVCFLLSTFFSRALLESSCSAKPLLEDSTQQPSTGCSQFSTAISIGGVYLLLECPGSSGESPCLEFTEKDTAVASLLLTWSDLANGWNGWV